MDKLPFDQQAEQPLWEKLAVENEAARVRTNRQAFSFIDLTSRDVLPLWMAPEDVGGRLNLGDQAHLDGGTSIDSLRQLGQALKSATDSPRFLRSMGQFTACFTKYAYVAVAMGQLSWMQVALHLGVVSQLAERERAKGNPPHAAILYDELLRRQIASRVSRNEVVDLTVVLSSVDKELWDTVQQRLGSVLQAAGLKPSSGTPSGAAPSSGPDVSAQHTQQMEAARKAQESMTKAAENLAAQQRNILD